MTRFHAAFAAALILPLSLIACGGDPAANEAAAEGEAAPAGDYERGPHNGRMLREGNFALEITVFEDGVPPEYRLYAYRDNKPVAPGEVQAGITIRRLDGEVTTFSFKPEQDYLRGNATLVEPHSFDVAATATEGGRKHSWKFPSYEGRVTIAAAAARAAGMEIENAGPATIGEALERVHGGRDPALAKLDADSRKATPMPDDVRKKLAELRGRKDLPTETTKGN